MRNFIVTPDGNQVSIKYPDDRDIELGTLIDLFTKRGDIEVKETYYVTKINQSKKAVFFYVDRYIAQ